MPVPAAASPHSPGTNQQAEQIGLKRDREFALPAHIGTWVLLAPGVRAAVRAAGGLLPLFLARERTASVDLFGQPLAKRVGIALRHVDDGEVREQCRIAI